MDAQTNGKFATSHDVDSFALVWEKVRKSRIIPELPEVRLRLINHNKRNVWAGWRSFGVD